jgi:hypothetical protein
VRKGAKWDRVSKKDKQGGSRRKVLSAEDKEGIVSEEGS